jgi:hypothetical protein
MRWPVIGVIVLAIAAPNYIADFKESDYLRLGDGRVATSHWLESNVRVPSSLAEEYSVGDFLPHVSGYQGGSLGWTTVHSILEKTADQWWAQGVMYVIADSRTTTDSWFDPATDKSLLKGFTLAYESPQHVPGPQMAIFYTFDIKVQADLHVGDFAQVFGYNVDKRQVCPGAQLPMRIFLRALRTTDIYYQTEITLRDAATGAIVFTQRQAPAMEQRPTTVWQRYELIFDDHWLNIPDNMPAGTYTLNFSVYEPYHGFRVNVSDRDNHPLGDTVALGQIQVSESYCPALF